MIKHIKTMEQLKDSRLLYEKKLPAFGYILLLTITLFLAVVIVWSIKSPKTYIVSSPGTVQSTNKNYVMSPYSGKLVAINITEGMNVEKGEVLFSIKSTDLDLQSEQLKGQKEIYSKQIKQYDRLVQSIKDGANYFDPANPEDSLYYNQYEAYQSQIAQNELDASTFKAYGYSEEQIEGEMQKNQKKLTEIYYAAIKAAEESILQAQTQIGLLDAQLSAVGSGQEEYEVTANATGKIHMMADYKEGMVIQAASPIASIASEQDKYSIQASVSVADVPRIHIGDKVDIAVAGLTQAVYGTISGKVTRIDSDVTNTQSEDGKSTSSFFKVDIIPDYTYLLSKNGDKVNISNGMAVETRIQYDKVTYFEYVLEGLGVLSR